MEPKLRPSKRRTKYDWELITVQFLTTDHADFRSFAVEMGYPTSIVNNSRARNLAEKKRRVITAQTDRIKQSLLAEPLREREARKFTVLKELENAGRALQAVVMNNILPDLEITRRKEKEPVEAWIERLKTPAVAEFRLTPGETMALGVALKHADDLIRKAAGLEDFNWDHAEQTQKALAKAGKLEFEIVHTSNAKPLDQLPHAPEDRKEVG